MLSRLLPISPKTSTDLVKEVEETIEQFATELELDNERLLETLARMKEEHHSELQGLNRKIEQLHKRDELLAERMEQFMKANTASSSESKPDKSAAPVEAVPDKAPEKASLAESSQTLPETVTSRDGMNLKQRYPELFALYEQGKSIEVIARKFGMNKGEVNLIVQLGKQEENSHERVQA
ncbi:hypothetical protein J2TS4_23060 [Paenibacillus sp. J2TS4]|nr:hypothetical protein J2TS4_23060 [Paenibacillus sp. J2TS4]